MRDNYVLRLRSSTPLVPEVIKEVLAGNVIRQLVFPAAYYYSDLSEEQWCHIDRTGSAEGFEHRFKKMILESFDSSLIDRTSPSSACLDLYFGNNQEGKIGIYVSFSDNPQSTLSLVFPEELKMSGTLSSEYCLSILHEILPKFKPHSGDVYHSPSFGTDSLSLSVCGKLGLQDTSYELEVLWINFYSQDLLARIGRERIERLRGFASRFEERDDGIIVCLVDEMFDAENPAHMAKLEEARRIVNFEEIATEIYSREIEVIG